MPTALPLRVGAATIPERARQVARIARFAIGVVVTASLVTGLAGVAVATLPALFGEIRAVVITSGSMSPHIDAGDVVLVRPSAGESLTEGVVATFRDPSGPGLVTHRIIDVDEHGRYVTKGDANETADSTPVRPAQLTGSAVLLVPLVGIPLAWFEHGGTVGGAAAALLIGFALWVSRFGWQARFDPWAMPRAVEVANR